MPLRGDGADVGPAEPRATVNRTDIMREITHICQPLQPMQDDEVTVGQMAKLWNRPLASTRAALDREVTNGNLTRRKALNQETGRECWAYRVVA